MKELARTLRKNQTDAEAKLWSLLRSRQFLNCKFRRQYVVKGYIVDFCCIEERLILEIDGSQHAQIACSDRRRTEVLEKDGYKVLRFWNHEVLTNTNAVLEKIYQCISGSHLRPLSKGEGKRKRNEAVKSSPLRERIKVRGKTERLPHPAPLPEGEGKDFESFKERHRFD